MFGLMTEGAEVSLPNEASMFSLSYAHFLLFGVIGTVVYFIKDNMEEIVMRIFFFMLDINDTDPEFHWFQCWFSFHPYTMDGSAHIKPFQKRTNKVQEYDDTPNEFDSFDLGKDSDFKKTKFVPAYGYHIIYIEGKPMIINLISVMPSSGNVSKMKENVEIYKPRYQFIDKVLRLISPCTDENNCPDPVTMAKSAGLNTSSFLSQRYEKMEKTTEVVKQPKFTSNTVFMDFMANCYYINTLYMKEKTTIFTQNYGRWTASCIKHKRAKESVILDKGVWESLYSDVEQFLNSRDWYYDHGIPYRRGYLLYGPPGTGKSSTIGAIAAAFNMNVCVVNLASKDLNDEELGYLFSSAPLDAIIVMEDVDSSFANDAPEVTPPKDEDGEQQSSNDNNSASNVIQTKSQITFSGILNAIDGIAAQESRMVFMTTNYKDKLPPALIRNGRIDKKIYVGHATEHQFKTYVRKFYEKDNIPKDEFEQLIDSFWEKVKTYSICMAQLQGFLLLYRFSLKEAVEGANDFENYLNDK